MKGSQKTTKTARPTSKPSTTPAQLPFEKWRKEFEMKLGVGKPSWKALQRLIEVRSAAQQSHRVAWERTSRLRKIPLDPKLVPGWDDDVLTGILHRLYEKTCPPDQQSVRNRRKHGDYIVRALGKLAADAEKLAANLRTSGDSIEDNDGLFTVRLTPLLKTCDALVAQSQFVIGFVRRPYTHKPDVVTQCAGLFLQLTESTGVTEWQALSLLRVALRAHGYDEVSLKSFFNIRAGTVRKSAHAFRTKLMAKVDDIVNRGR